MAESCHRSVEIMLYHLFCDIIKQISPISTHLTFKLANQMIYG